MSVYLVNQGKTYKHEKDGGYIWSPKLNRAGHQNKGYSLMMEVRKGDFIVHNSGGKLSAISVVKEDCKSGSQPIELRDGQNEYDWGDDGWLINTEYYEFTAPIITSDLVTWAAQNYKNDSAFQKDGKIRLQYLCNLENSHAEYLLQKAFASEKKPEVIEVLHAALKDENYKTKGKATLRLNKITLENIRNFKKIHEFDFSEANYINTISGINGSGKSTVFECVSICQKAYFVNKYFPSGQISELSIKYNSILSKDIANIVSEWRASIELSLSLEDDSNYEDGATEKRILKIKLKIKAKNWELIISSEDDAVIEKYWNTYNPTNIIVLLDADKMVDEEDFTFQKINMMSESKGEVIDFIMDPKKTYQNLYNIAMNAYIYNRLVPSTAGNNRKDQFTVESKIMFQEIMESHNISISNFSGQQKENQFVLTANKNGKYDMRQMSSGEKLIWYILLLFNYIKSISVLIIDEPENHLHEQLSWSLVNYLIKINEEHINGVGIGQVFLLTHAKNLIYNNFSEGVNYLLDASSPFRKIERERCEDILRSCGISYIDDKVLYVEGSTDIKLLNAFCMRENIKIRELTSCSEIIRVYKSLLIVKELVYVPRFVFLIDKDTHDESEIIAIRDKDTAFFDAHFAILPCHEIENFMLDGSIIAEQFNKLMHTADPDFKDDISSEDVLSIMRKIADRALQDTKNKYINNEMRALMQSLAGLVKIKEIVSDTEKEFDTYVDALFESDEFNKKKKDIKQIYYQMSEKYKDEIWDTKWIELCDGKRVYGMTINHLTKGTLITSKSLDKNIKDEIKRNENSNFIKWWTSVVKKFY